MDTRLSVLSDAVFMLAMADIPAVSSAKPVTVIIIFVWSISPWRNIIFRLSSAFDNKVRSLMVLASSMINADGDGGTAGPGMPVIAAGTLSPPMRSSKAACFVG